MVRCKKNCNNIDRFSTSFVNHALNNDQDKNKGGDLTDANNYRAIALSNVDTKILERLMLPQITTFDSTSDKYQFGFKPGHSTSQCAGAVKQVVNYYVNKNSHVFACLKLLH